MREGCRERVSESEICREGIRESRLERWREGYGERDVDRELVRGRERGRGARLNTNFVAT